MSVDTVTNAALSGISIASIGIPVLAAGSLLTQTQRLGRAARVRRSGGVSDIIFGAPRKRRVTKRRRRRK